MAPAVDKTAHPPVRIPKLKYRNSLPSDQASIPLLQYPLTTPRSTSAAATIRPSLGFARPPLPSLDPITPSTASSNDHRSSRKRTKTASVLSFLSLKEPSQSALDQFAEQQRRQVADKTAAISLPPSSTNHVDQKLPANVPKVNSKWDGVPGVKKNRYSMSSAYTKDSRRTSPRNSLSTQMRGLPWDDSRLAAMTDDTRNSPATLASPTPQPSGCGSSIGFIPSTATMPEISYYFPDAMAASNALPSKPLMPSGLPTDVSETRSNIDASVDSRAESPASSTDSVNTVVRDTANTIFKKLNNKPNQDNRGHTAYAVQPPSSDRIPDSHDFLFHDSVGETQADGSPLSDLPVSPASAITSAVPHYAPARPHNFSRPMSLQVPRSRNSRSLSSFYRRTPSALTLPTLYEVSHSSSTESLGTIRDNGEGDGEGEGTSAAPSTVASSELSKHWYESPRERLGLGGRLKMNETSPWDGQGEKRGKPKKSRLSIFGLGTKT